MAAFQGKVSSTKNAQTATVVVRRRARHPLYGKAISKTKKYHVHDTIGVSVGDDVQFVPCRPISKTKKWTITNVVSKAGIVDKKESKAKVDTKKAKIKKASK